MDIKQEKRGIEFQQLTTELKRPSLATVKVFMTGTE
jgi:hypothetical protein